jgi:hypothetical protein
MKGFEHEGKIAEKVVYEVDRFVRLGRVSAWG